jgi:phosphomannomutase
VGRLHLTKAMQEQNAAFGGELSGHYYWKEFGGMEAPELTLLRLYDLVARSGHSLTDLVAPYRTMQKSDEISVPVRDGKHATAVLQKLKAHFRHGDHDTTDGLTVEFPDWWFNIRPSNTEPLMRLVVEADKKDLLERMLKEIVDVVSPAAR